MAMTVTTTRRQLARPSRSRIETASCVVHASRQRSVRYGRALPMPSRALCTRDCENRSPIADQRLLDRRRVPTLRKMRGTRSVFPDLLTTIAPPTRFQSKAARRFSTDDYGDGKLQGERWPLSPKIPTIKDNREEKRQGQGLAPASAA
ncbi:hypothetical protein HN011_006872 [Eciton burchellii]|nr:hypothetical protein HN011_006872 [Eciton burchellii]